MQFFCAPKLHLQGWPQNGSKVIATRFLNGSEMDLLALASPMSCAVAMCLFPAVFRGCQRRRGASAGISAACAGSMECLQRRFLPLLDPLWLGLFRAHPTPPSPMRASDIGEMGIGTCLTHAVLVSNSWRPTCRVLSGASWGLYRVPRQPFVANERSRCYLSWFVLFPACLRRV